ncbi:coiled-coil domain-containing protein mad1 [Coemansia aciculifera]|nr:coiled-coil domain-containing protein mad1 [Coemansia aciculifera]
MTPVVVDSSRVAALERDVAEQCAYIRAAEAQNRELRSEVRRLTGVATQSSTFREASQALQAKVQRLEAQLADNASRDALLDQLQQERALWTQVFSSSSPVVAAQTADAQRRTIAVLERSAAERQERLDDAVAQLDDARAQLARVRRESEESWAGLRAAEAALERAQTEADFLRAQLASYDAEDERLKPAGGPFDAAKSERIRRLELFVDQQRQWMRAGEAAGEIPDVAPLLAGLREELAAASERCQRLEREAARLDHVIGSGLGYDPRTTRVLQLADNPAARDFAIRSAQLEALAAENAQLVDRLRASSVAANEGAGEERSPLFCTIDNLRKDNEALAAQLQESAKLMARYKKQWKRQSARLRDIVYAVLGFRVDFLANGHVRLTSAYAQDIDHNFMMSEDPSNSALMRLVGGTNKQYLTSLNNDMRFWIQERGSIPGFMATVTLQNFEAKPAGTQLMPPTNADDDEGGDS